MMINERLKKLLYIIVASPLILVGIAHRKVTGKSLGLNRRLMWLIEWINSGTARYP